MQGGSHLEEKHLRENYCILNPGLFIRSSPSLSKHKKSQRTLNSQPEFRNKRQVDQVFYFSHPGTVLQKHGLNVFSSTNFFLHWSFPLFEEKKMIIMVFPSSFRVIKSPEDADVPLSLLQTYSVPVFKNIILRFCFSLRL